jgi:hypothetical protein
MEWMQVITIKLYFSRFIYIEYVLQNVWK